MKIGDATIRRSMMALIILAAIGAALPTSAMAKGIDRKMRGASSASLSTDLRAFEKFTREHMRKENVPSLTIGFVKDGKTWVRAFGTADVENGVAATPESTYRYASIQKSMTSTAVLQLVANGKMSLDAQIQTYVPYFPRKPYPITVRQLLTHLSGLPHYVNREVEQHFTVHKTTRESIAVFENFDLIAIPGTKWNYSSYGYNLLGAAIEGASGQSYADYMRDHVWAPAGMTATRMDDPVAIIPHRVSGYVLDASGHLANSEHIDVSSRFAAGGARGTVPDLLRYLAALDSGKLLNSASVSLMFTPVHTSSGGPTGYPRTNGYAMGWSVIHRSFGDVLVNDGGQQETRTFILTIPSRHISIALAQNLEKDNYTPILFRLYEILVGEKLIPDKTSQ